MNIKYATMSRNGQIITYKAGVLPGGGKGTGLPDASA